MKALIKKQIGRVARLYHRVRSSRVVWWGILNHNGRMLLKHHPPTLSGTEQEVLRQLREDGIAIVPIESLLPESVFLDLQKYALRRWSEPDVMNKYDARRNARSGDKLMSKDYFLVDLWEGPPELDLANPFTRFSLGDRILNIVNSYLGTFSKFRGWHLQVTIPMPEGDRRYASQEWHRDPEDQRLVKTFLYLSDVSAANGPFMYLKKSHAEGKWRGLFPQSPPRGSAGKESGIPTEDIVVCTGGAGTLIFCDTTGLHRGGYASGDIRSMYTSVYTTPASVWPITFSYKDSQVPTDLSPAAAFALDNDPHQKEPRFYKM